MSFFYNRICAAMYAQQFALHYNPEWPKDTADCTNFVSQALLAGGWEMIEGFAADDRSWFGSDADSICGGQCYLRRSRTWAGAEPFARFLKASGRADPCERSALALGDVVQLLTDKGEAAHSMIVTKVDGGEAYLSYHTKDVLNNPLSAIIAKTSESVRYWKIKDFPPATPSGISLMAAAALV
jgi:Putative amidase domain